MAVDESATSAPYSTAALPAVPVATATAATAAAGPPRRRPQPAEAHHARERQLEADGEQEEEDPEFREACHRVLAPDQSQAVRPDRNAGEQEGHHGGPPQG